MSLKVKVVLILSLFVVLNVAVGFVAREASIYPAFAELERQQAVRAVQRCRSALEREIAAVDRLCRDWSVWDDTYRFVADGNAGYRKANLGVESMVTADLDCLLILDHAGRRVGGELADLASRTPIRPSPFDGDGLEPGSPLLQRSEEDALQGLLRTERGVMLLAARPILTSAGQGPARGTLIMGRFLDAGLIESLRNQTRRSLSFTEIPVAEAADLPGSPEITPIPPCSEGSRRLEASEVLADLSGRAVVRMELVIPRRITVRGAEVLFRSHLTATTGALALLGILLLFTSATVTRRLSRLTRSVVAFASERRGNAEATPPDLDGGDEIRVLHKAFEHLKLCVKARERELRKAREAAENATAAKSRFLATVTHEIRTPINAITGMAEMLMEETPDRSEREPLRAIRSASESLGRLVADLLDFSRIEAGKMQLQREPFNLREAVVDAVRIVRSQAQDKALEVAGEVDDDVPWRFLGDAMRLRQVLVNLLGNGVKFTDDGSVRLGVRIGPDSPDEQGRVRLSFIVSDTGRGIPPAEQETVFEPFAQGGSGDETGGTGLGLAICREIVERMDGRIWLASEVGQGTTVQVEVCLPLAEPRLDSRDRAGCDARSVAWRADDESPPGPLRILVAEDNRANRVLIERLLKKGGAEVTLVTDGAAAVEAARDGDFDAVLMDVEMPGTDGLAATAAIRAAEGEGARAPIAAMTAHLDEDVHRRCREAGMDARLDKPVRAAALWEVLGELTGVPTGRTASPSSGA